MPTRERRPVLATDGYDFLDKDKTRSTSSTPGLLANPGARDRRAASVIVSPKGRQMPGEPASEFVSGVAPGARLVPLRVAPLGGPLRTGNLAARSASAAGDDRTLVKKKGGRDLDQHWAACRDGRWWEVRRVPRATQGRDRGGAPPATKVKIVGPGPLASRRWWRWPRATWTVEYGKAARTAAPSTSTAPGESVWRASTDPPGTDSSAWARARRSATATVAGVAALWVAYHRDDPEMAILKRTGW